MIVSIDMLSKYLSDIGKLDRRIAIRSTTYSQNAFGHNTNPVNTDIAVNAAYSYSGKDEKDELGKETNYQYLHFIIRYMTVLMTSKVVFEGIEYDIVNIEPIGRRRFLKLKVKDIQ